MKKTPVLDSWEDEDDASEKEETLTTSAPPPKSKPQPSSNEQYVDYHISPQTGDTVTTAKSQHARPEKTDAAAKRMIAGALGLRAPKKTEEQRAYDRAIKEKEMKRRNAEKDAEKRSKEEAERQKAAVWDD